MHNFIVRILEYIFSEIKNDVNVFTKTKQKQTYYNFNFTAYIISFYRQYYKVALGTFRTITLKSSDSGICFICRKQCILKNGVYFVKHVCLAYRDSAGAMRHASRRRRQGCGRGVRKEPRRWGCEVLLLDAPLTRRTPLLQPGDQSAITGVESHRAPPVHRCCYWQAWTGWWATWRRSRRPAVPLGGGENALDAECLGPSVARWGHGWAMTSVSLLIAVNVGGSEWLRWRGRGPEMGMLAVRWTPHFVDGRRRPRFGF